MFNNNKRIQSIDWLIVRIESLYLIILMQFIINECEKCWKKQTNKQNNNYDQYRKLLLWINQNWIKNRFILNWIDSTVDIYCRCRQNSKHTQIFVCFFQKFDWSFSRLFIWIVLYSSIFDNDSWFYSNTHPYIKKNHS